MMHLATLQHKILTCLSHLYHLMMTDLIQAQTGMEEYHPLHSFSNHRFCTSAPDDVMRVRTHEQEVIWQEEKISTLEAYISGKILF